MTENDIDDTFEADEYSAEYDKTSPFSPMDVEECFQIYVGSFGRGLLRPDRDKFGVAAAWSIRGFKTVEYEIIPGDDPILFVQYDVKKTRRCQEIYIDTIQTRFGQKPYLLCKCGHRGKLYLRPDLYHFACRSCLNLRYVLTTVNKNTIVGSLAYRAFQGLKIDLLRARIRREVYNGHLTRRALSIMKKCTKFRVDDLAKLINA